MGLQTTGQGDGTPVDPGDLTEVRRWICEDKADRNKGLGLRENREEGGDLKIRSLSRFLLNVLNMNI